MKWLKNNIYIAFGILLILMVGISLLSNFTTAKVAQKEKVDRITNEINELTADEGKEIEELKELPHYNEDKVEKSVVDGTVLERTDAYERLSGVIRNERVGLEEPIYKGASEVNMRKGVATLNPTDDLNQKLLGISGHRSPVRYQYFSEVPRLVEGDIVTIDLYDKSGKIGENKYKITKKYDLLPSDRETLDKEPNEPTLRLVTCDVWNYETKTYDKRLITEGVKIN